MSGKTLSPPPPSLSPNPGGGASVASSGNRAPLPTADNLPPRPQIPPGHAGPVRNPHPHDVLSGRGGRINSHPGNVRFRETVDSYKREYLDPRTKKVEKARIAARIVANVRNADPPGRFLKEDPHTGLWVEIGDERAWKKAGQALRESAPEIRAERQMQLQMMAGVGPGPGASVGPGGSVGGGGGGGSVVDSIATGGGRGGGGKGGGGRRSRQADPPGPRHRPNPPQREGLARSNDSSRNGYGNNDFDELSPRGRQGQMNQMMQNQMGAMPGMLDEDMELARMRREYLQMQRLQQEQQLRMLQYQTQLQRQQQAQQRGGGGGDAVHDEYDRMKRELMTSYREQVHRTAQLQLAADRARRGQMGGGIGGGGGGGVGGGGGGMDPNDDRRGHQNRDHRDIAAAIMDDGLLPVNAGFDIPALRGERSESSLLYEQQLMQQQQQEYAANNNDNAYQGAGRRAANPGAVRAQEAFDRHFNSCDKTVSTMSSFDVQSMDMSSLGGFSWRDASHSGYNMSGLISTSSTQVSSSRTNNYNASGGTMGTMSTMGRRDSGGRGGGKSKGGKSALERKLEKVNRKQKMQEMQQRGQAMHGQPHPQGGIVVATATGGASQESQQQQRGGNKSKKHSQEPNSSNHNMSSLHSFGFEAIEEDELTEASYKMSNLGLSNLSEMDMTFGPDDLSVRSKGTSKSQEKEGKEGKGSGKKKASRGKTLVQKPPKRSGSDGEGKEGGGATASGAFDHSLSSTGSGGIGGAEKKSHDLSMEDFNESFKSMEMEDQRRSGAGTGGAEGGGATGRKPPDPDGAVGGRPPSSSSSRRKADPGGGRRPSVPPSRASRHGAPSASAHRAPADDRASSDARRGSAESMGISDPDMLGNSLGNSGLSGLVNSNGPNDFGVSLDSLRSFQSHDGGGGDDGEGMGGSDASSWLQQYNSMENVDAAAGDGRNPWDDEDAEDGASGGTSASGISAPRMVMATGGDP